MAYTVPKVENSAEPAFLFILDHHLYLYGWHGIMQHLASKHVTRLSSPPSTGMYFKPRQASKQVSKRADRQVLTLTRTARKMTFMSVAASLACIYSHSINPPHLALPRLARPSRPLA